MQSPNAKPVDTARARQIWEDYARAHDLSSENGRVAAIDPESGRIWIGMDALETADRMHADGYDVPVYLVRVGYDHYVRKGRR